MLETIIPQELNNVINYRLNKNYVYEIRIRANKPVIVNYLGKYEFLSKTGITKDRQVALILTSNDIKTIILKASNYSIYSINEQLKAQIKAICPILIRGSLANGG